MLHREGEASLCGWASRHRRNILDHDRLTSPKFFRSLLPHAAHLFLTDWGQTLRIISTFFDDNDQEVLASGTDSVRPIGVAIDILVGGCSRWTSITLTQLT